MSESSFLMTFSAKQVKRIYIINFLIQNINIQDVDTITGHLNWILYLSAIRPGLCFPKKEKNYQQQQKIILKCSPLL